MAVPQHETGNLRRHAFGGSAPDMCRLEREGLSQSLVIHQPPSMSNFPSSQVTLMPQQAFYAVSRPQSASNLHDLDQFEQHRSE